MSARFTVVRISKNVMFLFCEFTEAVCISPSARFDEHCVTSVFAVVCVFYKRGSRGVWIGSFALPLQDVSAVEVLNLPQKYHPSLWLLLYVASEKFKCSHCTSVEDVCVAGLHFFPIKSIDLCGCLNYLVNFQSISGFNTHITGIPPLSCLLEYCCFYVCCYCYLTSGK